MTRRAIAWEDMTPKQRVNRQKNDYRKIRREKEKQREEMEHDAKHAQLIETIGQPEMVKDFLEVYYNHRINLACHRDVYEQAVSARDLFKVSRTHNIWPYDRDHLIHCMRRGMLSTEIETRQVVRENPDIIPMFLTT